MKLLLDSHTFIWTMLDPDKLSKKVRQALEDQSNELFLSIGTLWELVIKESLEKLSLPKGVMGLYNYAQEQRIISLLQLEPTHLKTLSELPFHHRDPFDRILISQALLESIPLVTRDKEFKKYKIKTMW